MANNSPRKLINVINQEVAQKYRTSLKDKTLNKDFNLTLTFSVEEVRDIIGYLYKCKRITSTELELKAE